MLLVAFSVRGDPAATPGVPGGTVRPIVSVVLRVSVVSIVPTPARHVCAAT